MATKKGKTGRPKPLTSKISVTRDGKRLRSEGGKLYKCGGKLKK